MRSGRGLEKDGASGQWTVEILHHRWLTMTGLADGWDVRWCD